MAAKENEVVRIDLSTTQRARMWKLKSWVRSEQTDGKGHEFRHESKGF